MENKVIPTWYETQQRCDRRRTFIKWFEIAWGWMHRCEDRQEEEMLAVSDAWHTAEILVSEGATPTSV